MINRERLINEFCRLVSIDSVTFDERKMADYIISVFREMGTELYEDNAGKVCNSSTGNLYGYIEGDGEPILLCAHMDTVEPGAGKRAVIHSDGIITSGGNTVLGADDAAGLAVIIEAIRSAKENSRKHRPAELLFSVAEEVYTKGTRAFDFSKIRSREAYVLDLSGEIGTAALSAPSIISFNAEIKGKAAHSGFSPEEGINAIAITARAIANIRQGRLDKNTTLNIGIITGGTATNIVPESCTVKGEIRSLDHSNAMDILEYVRESIEKECLENNAVLAFGHTVEIKAYEINKKSPVVMNYEKVCKELDMPVKLISTFGGSDNNNIVQKGIDGIVISCGMNNVHSCQEYTSIDELVKCTEIISGLIMLND